MSLHLASSVFAYSSRFGFALLRIWLVVSVACGLSLAQASTLSTSSFLIKSGDYDNDGDTDLLLEAQSIIFTLGVDDFGFPYSLDSPFPNYILENIGNNRFRLLTNVSILDAFSPSWNPTDYYKDVQDVNGDGLADLVIKDPSGSLTKFLLLGASDVSLNLSKQQQDVLSPNFRAALIDPADDALAAASPYHGQLVGDFSVGDDGSANYLLPIEVPPGINGMQPELSLRYNSNSKNGVIGKGWMLSGLSKIQRCNANQLRDGYVDGINDDDNYKFCLDGQRLVQVSPGEYRTERESFNRITRYGTNPAVPDYWTVETKNGRSYRYGNNSEAKQYSAAGKAYAWHLDRLTDTAGNYMVILYESTNFHRVASIQYTFNDAGASLNNKISFIYESRNDIKKQFIAGASETLDERLSQIITYANDSPVFYYKLRYQQFGASYFQKVFNDPAKTSRLAEIAKYADLADQPEIMKFDWSSSDNVIHDIVGMPQYPGGDDSQSREYRYQDLADAGGVNFLSVIGDFTGDQKMDVVGYNSIINGTYNLKLIKGDDGSIVSTGINLPEKVTEYYELSGTPGNKTVNWGAPIVIDLNSDGKDDYFFLSALSRTQGARAYVSTGDTLVEAPGYSLAPGSISTRASYKFSSGPIAKRDIAYRLTFIDFNGDGLIDVLRLPPTEVAGSVAQWFSGRVSDVSIALGEADGFGAFSPWMNADDLKDLYGEVQVADVNGDSLPDLVTANGAVAINTGSSFAATPSWRLPGRTEGDNRNLFRPHMVFDVNGDGLADLVQPYFHAIPLVLGDYSTRVALSTGDGFGPLEIASSQSWTGHQPYVQDMNGDGLNDLVLVEFPNDSYFELDFQIAYEKYGLQRSSYVLYSDGQGGFHQPVTFGTPTKDLDPNDWINFETYYFATQRLNSVSQEINGFYSSIKGNLEPNDNWVTVNYKALNPYRLQANYWPDDRQNPIYHQQPQGIVSGARAGNYGVSVSENFGNGPNDHYYAIKHLPALASKRGVASYNKGLGAGNEAKVSYNYYDSAVDLAGFGNLGFAKIEKKEERSPGLITGEVTEYSQETGADYSLARRPTKRTVYATDIDRDVYQKISETEFRWKVRVWADDTDGFVSPHYFPYKHSTVSQNWDLGGNYTHHTATQSFDDGTVDCVVPSPTVVRELDDIEYDANGNLLYFQSMTCDSFGVTAKALHQLAFDDIITPSRWVLGLPSTTEQISWVLDARDLPQISLTTDFKYTSLGQLKSKTIATDDNDLKKQRSYTYNIYGSVASETIDWSSQPSNGLAFKSVTHTYDESYSPAGEKIIITTNPLEQQTETVYDPRFGSVKQFTDANNLTDTTYYDRYGRVSSINYSDGTQTSVNYYKCSDCDGLGSLPAHQYYVKTKTTGQAPTYAYVDDMGRNVLERYKGFSGELIDTHVAYNEYGLVAKAYAPSVSGHTPEITLHNYDVLGRPTLTTYPDTSLSSITYSGLQQVLTNQLGQEVRKLFNGAGQLMSVTDDIGTVVHFRYNPLGNLASSEIIPSDGSANIMITMGYDNLGRKTFVNDPNTGLVSYEYNGLDAVYSQRDANNIVTQYGYDELGREIRRVWNAEAANASQRTSRWAYDSAPGKGIGQLASVVGYDTDGRTYSETYAYNNYGSLTEKNTSIGGLVYNTGYYYDGFNRPLGTRYPTDVLVTGNEYNNYGYLSVIYDATPASNNGFSLWQGVSADAWGNTTEEILGNGVTTMRYYTPDRGLIESITSSIDPGTGVITIQDQVFNFDSLGNLKYRLDTRSSQQQNFCYDQLNRLVGSSFGVCGNTDYQYNAIGNLIKKGSQVSSLQYAGPRPNAVTQATIVGTLVSYQYDNAGNIIRRGTDTIEYSPFNKPVRMDGNGQRTDVVYGSDEHRIERRDGGKVTVYIDKLYEEVTDGTSLKSHFYVGDALYTYDGTTGYWQYMHRDHLGSVVATSGESVLSGSDVQWQAFDVWGGALEDDWEGNAAASVEPTGRGFTGHEHLLEVGLIHMNGRVYDPLIGRFLSPDPYVNDPYNTQSYNRYSYVLNNPLSYTDPTGYTEEVVVTGKRTNSAGSSMEFSVTFGVAGAFFTGGIPNLTADQFNAVLSGIDDQAQQMKDEQCGGNSFCEGTVDAAADIVKTVAKAMSSENLSAGEKAQLGASLAVTVIAGNAKSVKNISKSVVNSSSNTARQALRKAKDANGIPKSAQPDRIIKPGTPEGNQLGLDNRNVKLYEYTNSNGQKIHIRQDKAATYGQGVGDQKPHFNAGPAGDNLKQHHYYGK